MEISPLGGTLGAEIRDIKLKNLDAAVIDAIRTTFLEYLVLVFPKRQITIMKYSRDYRNFQILGFLCL